jgi:L-threonylcarbamoyladenylate synthase
MIAIQPMVRGINHSRPDPDLIKSAAEILRNKGIVVAPTETRYGLLASIDSNDALQRLFNLKRRQATLPTAIFVGHRTEIKKFGVENDVSKKLAEEFLPGPMTIVLKAAVSYSAPIVSNGKIGIRISSSAVIAGILEHIDFGLTATSANLSGGDEKATISEIVNLFGSGVDLYLDAGSLTGKPSTVVDCSGDKYMILRIGAICESDIFRCLVGIA